MKYVFINKYGHPFARKLRLWHFNPYGYVPQDPKVVEKIDHAMGDDWKLFIEASAALVRSLVDELKPDVSVLPEGQKMVTWQHFSLELRTELYKQADKGLPTLYHLRDQTNNDSWFVAELARDYLSANKSYEPRRKHIKNPKTRMRRNATKIAENAAKQYPVPPREEDLYYIKAPTGGYNTDDPKKKCTPISNARPDVPSGSS
ncbi:hypothetical protein OPQ81_003312 [Rhizoctonia solani]|nr:hypothetical protein OPQ81_003312 [Rhizoctonia solani]